MAEVSPTPTPQDQQQQKTTTSTSDYSKPAPNPENPNQTQHSNPRLAALESKKSTLTSTLQDLQTQKSALVSTSTLPSGLAMPATWSDSEKSKSALETSNAVIKEHIALLHRYNEVKDIAQGLMGLIAEARGVRVKVVMEEFGVGEGD